MEKSKKPSNPVHHIALSIFIKNVLTSIAYFKKNSAQHKTSETT
jgi:hypothetical protein